MRTDGIIVQWHPASETGFIRSGAHAQPHLFRLRDLRSDCPAPAVGMSVQFESVQLPDQAPRALAVGVASPFMPLPPERPATAPDGSPLAAMPPASARRAVGWRQVMPQLMALLALAASAGWLWTHPLP